MTAGINNRALVHCCDCGKNFTISGGIASDCTDATIRCPYCGKNGALGKECRR